MDRNMDESLPLFDIIPKRNDPITSYTWADEMNKGKATKQRLEVLGYVVHFPGRTAKELGDTMVNLTGDINQVEVPHKSMVYLERAGLVRRENTNNRALKCYPTELGIQVNERARNANKPDTLR